MPASNNFLQWNPNENNQESDASYLADTARVNGATAGVFTSETANKLFFQLSTMVKAIADALTNKGYSPNDSSLSNLTAMIQPAVPQVEVIAAGQNIVVGDAGDCYVASTALTLTVAHSTTLNVNHCNLIHAEGGAVTIAINGADTLNGGSAGVGAIIPQGALGILTTDANGHLYLQISGFGKNFQVFGYTTSFGSLGTLTPTAGVYSNVSFPATSVLVEAWGGGGGAGGFTTSGNNFGAPGGGGAYGFKRCTLTSDQLVTITVGGGGVAAANSGPGVTGGTTSFGSFFSVLGGYGGPGNSGAGTQGGPAPSNVDLALPGGDTIGTFYITAGYMGKGGDAPRGGIGGIGTTSGGTAGAVPGGGGGPGGYGAGYGGAGGGGMVIVTW